MPEQWSWQRVSPSEEGLAILTRLLRRGGTVLLPTECGPVVTVSASDAGAVTHLKTLIPDSTPSLFVENRAAARDWAPSLGTAGSRLTDRLWPGPVAIVSNEGVSAGLVTRFPKTTQSQLVGSSGILFRRASHEAIETLRRRLGGPILGIPVSRDFLKTPPGKGLLHQLDLLVDDENPHHQLTLTILQVGGDSWTLLQPGAITEADIAGQLARWVIFICTGNTCRSPMAEVICKKVLSDQLGCPIGELPRHGWMITSAGLGAIPGMPAAHEAVHVASKFGCNLAEHRSQPLTAELATRADFLLGMTSGHVRAVRQILPHLPVEITLLCPDGKDVDDPIGQPLEIYEACARQMTNYIEAWVKGVLPK